MKDELIAVDGTPAKHRILLDFEIKSRTVPILTLAFAERFVMGCAVKHVLTRMGQLFRTRNP
jgi:hypothetical protein